jgi:hypothetical protein
MTNAGLKRKDRGGEGRGERETTYIHMRASFIFRPETHMGT